MLRTGVAPSEWDRMTIAEREAYGPASRRIRDQQQEE